METLQSNFILFKLSKEFGFRSEKNTPVNWTSFDINSHLSFGPCELVQITNHDVGGPSDFMRVYIGIKQEKVYTQGQLKLTHINLAILNSHAKSCI